MIPKTANRILYEMLQGVPNFSIDLLSVPLFLVTNDG